MHKTSWCLIKQIFKHLNIIICIFLYIIKRFNEWKINRDTPKQFPVQCPVKFQKKVFCCCFLICCSLLLTRDTGISCKEKVRKENFQMCLSLIFHNFQSPK